MLPPHAPPPAARAHRPVPNTPDTLTAQLRRAIPQPHRPNVDVMRHDAPKATASTTGRAWAPGAGWDERRNTSAVRQPPPNALPDALQACAALRRSDPALVAWLLDGHPSLTEDEHRERFGGPYKGHRSRKGD